MHTSPLISHFTFRFGKTYFVSHFFVFTWCDAVQFLDFYVRDKTVLTESSHRMI